MIMAWDSFNVKQKVGIVRQAIVSFEARAQKSFAYIS